MCGGRTQLHQTISLASTHACMPKLPRIEPEHSSRCLMHASRRVTDEKGLRGLRTMRVQVAQRDVGHRRDISNRVLRRRASHMTRTYPSNDTIQAHHSLTSMSHCTKTVKESAHICMYVYHTRRRQHMIRERERERVRYAHITSLSTRSHTIAHTCPSTETTHTYIRAHWKR